MTQARCAVGMVKADRYNTGSAAWKPAGVRRAAAAVARRQAGKSDCGQRPRLTATNAVLKEAATGVGLTWEENGRTVKAQAWSPGPYTRSYWMKVWEPSAAFPGEFRLAYADENGKLSLTGRTYDAYGREVRDAA